jgi:starch synthase
MHDMDVLSGRLRAHAPPRPVPARLDAARIDIAPQRILYVTSEIADFVKAGGLGEVSAALPRTLKQQYDVRILVPGYRKVLEAHPHLPVVGRLRPAHGLPACEIGRFETIDGLIIYVLLCPDLYDRDGSPYGDEAGEDWADNDIRFARLGLAAAEIAGGLRDLGWKPDLLHLNDWPSALAAGYLAWREKPLPTVLTIHNLAYQGLFAPERLPKLGIPENAFQIEGVEFYGKVSFLKAGIVYSDHVTTVSSTYAREITTPELGCGLDGLLRVKADQGRLSGILNGIDESWDPRTDPHLASPFEPENLKGKVANRDEVRREFGLAVSRGPLFAVVSRLVHHKGVDLAIEATETILREGGQIAVTGKGEGQLEAELEKLAKRHPGKVGVKLGFEEGTARRMYAGSDFLLMPSRFEPCGLSQMYAQKFGSLPIAHRTGGLADTIEDGVTGFLFHEPSLGELIGAVYRAVDAYRSRKKLNRMRRAAMGRTFAWQRSAVSYKKVYDRALMGAARAG